MSLPELFDLLKYVRPRELVQIWKLPAAALTAPFVRHARPRLWIVSEDRFEARDNGWWFFKYVREARPEQDCVYAIDARSPDYHKVAALGETVEYGSLRHWILYLASSVQISSQKSGDPNAAIFYFLQVYGLLKNRRLFLQHGVTVSDQPWLYHRASKISRFLCGAASEYGFVRERFGYPDGCVRYTGLCRFDGLHDFETDPALILIMPTWRNWLAVRKDKLRRMGEARELAETEYFVKWREFLEDDALCELAETCHVRFLFYPHRNMQPYLSFFPSGLKHVELCSREDYDVQELLKRAALLVTDYSSVFFDMVYMKKPVVFYQFDLEKFRREQYAEGWFDYAGNSFGRSCRDRGEVYAQIRQSIESGYAVSRAYTEARARCFPLYDSQNTARAYDVAEELSSWEVNPCRR